MRPKNPRGTAVRWLCTCTAVHSLPQCRQYLCVTDARLREFTHNSQKYCWHCLQKKRPAIRWWNLQFCDPLPTRGGSGGATVGGTVSVTGWGAPALIVPITACDTTLGAGPS